MKKRNKNGAIKLIESLMMTFKASLVGIGLALTLFLLGNSAERATPDIGGNLTMLGHNRDWLISGHWFFFAMIFGFTLVAGYSWYKSSQIAKEVS